MKKTEKDRLTALVRDALNSLPDAPEKLQAHAAKLAKKYSVTSAEHYKTVSEFSWWLIASGYDQVAMAVLDGLIASTHDYYWIYDARTSALAARAMLRHKLGQTEAAQQDALEARAFIVQGMNKKPISKREANNSLCSFDCWMDRVAKEKGIVGAIGVLAHALRYLVMYQQFAMTDDPAFTGLPVAEFDERIAYALQALRRRIELWSGEKKDSDATPEPARNYPPREEIPEFTPEEIEAQLDALDLKSDWLKDDEIRKIMKGKPERLQAFVDASPLRAINANKNFMLLIRDHSSWFHEGEGWRDSNGPPHAGGESRQVINIYRPDSWSKMSVPKSYKIRALHWDGTRFVFDTIHGEISTTALHLWRVMVDSMSGSAQSEEEIERNFRKLDGSVPLQTVFVKSEDF